ncbi:hypothetical protein GCM10017161_11110 [Thalassotalea marina]|uniref:diguanylate cyclase n=2 Tax=Thalassotalea marina TaxID=1673741 RepID=A0A919BEG9_9GAMM|nr:hypothetical protein GCM10017161_11110 [Thalassotalea marina]
MTNMLRLSGLLFTILCLFIVPAWAEDLKGDPLSKDQILPIDDRINALLPQSKTVDDNVRQIYQRLTKQNQTFNVAENYLMLIIEANIATADGEVDAAISLLKQALALDEKMPSKQVYLPDFSQAHLLLSAAYAGQERFQEAYDAKKAYIDKHYQYREHLYLIRLAKLNEKYETDLKFKQNELLAKEQDVKELKLKDVRSKQAMQQRNLVVLTLIAIIFLALLFRQLRIRSILKHLAKTDSLTGLANRRTLFSVGERLFTQAKNNQHALAVMLLDIDYFKLINDEYGHDVGDKVIMAVVELGRETLRAKDTFARIGGEEFVVLLPYTQLKEAKAIAERFREKVQQFELEQVAPQMAERNVTISIGVAELTDKINDFDDLLHQADEAMYQAKENGRNQVCI